MWQEESHHVDIRRVVVEVFADVLDRICEAGVQIGPRLPAEALPGAVGVADEASDLAGAGALALVGAYDFGIRAGERDDYCNSGVPSGGSDASECATRCLDGARVV